MDLANPVAPPQRGFDVAEFVARTQRAQRQMVAQGIAGLLLMSEPEVRYFSGFQTLFWQSPTRPWFLFVPAAGKPVAVIPEIGAALMRRTWIDDIRTWSAPAPADDGVSLLAALLAPQLPLEAAMIRAGAFAGVDPAIPVESLLYLRLSGGRVPLEVAERKPKEGDVGDLAAEALARTRALFAGYENPATGYLSRARVMKEREFAAPYDHLARVREWALESGDDG